MRTLVYTLLLLIRYLITAGDISHFIHYCSQQVDIYSSFAFLGLLIVADIVVHTPTILKNVPMKFKIGAQLGIHALLAINSVYWMVKIGDKSTFGIITFIIVFLLFLVFGHKLLHAIHEEIAAEKKSKNST